MRNATILALTKLADNNKNVILITADLGFGLFEDFAKKFPSQFLNVGIAEQNMIGIASGLSIEGKIVFVYSIGNFPTLRCLEQIRNDASYHGLNVNIICMGAGFSYGALGTSHHATEDIAIMRALPGTSVISPSTDTEAYFATMSLADIKGVTYLRLDKSKVQSIKQTEKSLKIGKGNILKDGRDYTIISCGSITEVALNAAFSLEELGISCQVISMHTIKPIDIELIKKCINDSKGIITLEEGNISGGMGSAVLEACEKIGSFPRKLKILGIQDSFVSKIGSQDFLRKYIGLSKEAIEEVILNWKNS